MLEKRYFACFESRDAYLRERVGALLARRHAGLKIFWSDLRIARARSAVRRRDYGIISPNPFDYLAFDKVGLILNATRASASKINHVLQLYKLDFLRRHFLYTLSGGEALRVAMAKCALEIGKVQKLIIAGPWNGLSDDNVSCLESLIDSYTRHGHGVELLNLLGEDEPSPIHYDGGSKTVKFGLEAIGLRIPLSDPDRAVGSPLAQVEDFKAPELSSPCLIGGKNGHGKSLIVKAIAQTIDHAGSARITGRPNASRVRLIFQDVSSQSLLSTSSLVWELKRNAIARYLHERLNERIETLLPDRPAGVLDSSEHSLLSTKIAMIAIRLADEPSALILDEPDWGLSKPEAAGFFTAVADLCEFQKTPLLIITHRKWFENFFNSHLHVERAESDDRDTTGFSVRISRVS